MGSISPCPWAPSSGCSAPTARARRRPCASSQRSCVPTPEALASSDSTSSRRRTKCGPARSAGSRGRRREPHGAREPAPRRSSHALAGGDDQVTQSRSSSSGSSLTDAADRTVKTYSGGMRRRLDLGAALVHRRPVLFMDEPTTGLDPQSRTRIVDRPRRTRRRGNDACFSRRSISRRPIASPTASRWSITAGSSPRARPPNSRPSSAATVLEVTFADEDTAAIAAGKLARSTKKEPTVTGSSVELPVDEGATAVMAALRVSTGPSSRSPGCRCAGPASTTCSSTSPATRPVPTTTMQPPNRLRRIQDVVAAARRAQHELTAQCVRRRHDHDVAQPPRLHPHPRLDVLLECAANHVHVAVPLCVRRGHSRARTQLRRLPHGRHLRPDSHLRRHRHRGRSGRRHGQGTHRTVPFAADGQLSCLVRSHHRGSVPQRVRDRPDHRSGLRGRLSCPHRCARLHRGRSHSAPLRLLSRVGLRGDRVVGAQWRSRPAHQPSRS